MWQRGMTCQANRSWGNTLQYVAVAQCSSYGQRTFQFPAQLHLQHWSWPQLQSSETGAIKPPFWSLQHVMICHDSSHCFPSRNATCSAGSIFSRLRWWCILLSEPEPREKIESENEVIRTQRPALALCKPLLKVNVFKLSGTVAHLHNCLPSDLWMPLWACIQGARCSANSEAAWASLR